MFDGFFEVKVFNGLKSNLMTIGQNSELLPSAISSISKEVYEYLKASDIAKN